jgi:hypothetical protein
MSESARASPDGLPDEVVVHGGESKIYHRPAEGDVTRAACPVRGETTYLKQRSVVESHYTPCKRCFPDAGGGGR